jgi:signal transduction histidine kinase
MDVHEPNFQARLKQLEQIETEYRQLCLLIDAAAANHSFESMAVDAVLHTDPQTHHIIEANAAALALLGCPLEALIGQFIEAIEVADPAAPVAEHYIENALEMQFYRCFYRHANGDLIPVTVERRTIERDGHQSTYILRSHKPYHRLLRELHRREDTDYQFRERLKSINEINLSLSDVPTSHELCRSAIQMGVQRLGFDRISIWFLDKASKRMIGTFGVDEQGHLRDESAMNWSYEGTHIERFVQGNHEPVVRHDDAPIFNDRSEIVGYGWHISVPLLHHGAFVGFMSADNHLQKQPMKGYQPELLRIYGATIGHLVTHLRNQEAARHLEETIRTQQGQMRLLEAFLTHIGHDFRTPLTVINTNTYLLHKSQDNDRRAQLAQSIQDQVMHINRVIGEMGDLLKLEDQAYLDFKMVNLNTLIREVVQEFGVMAEAKQIALHYTDHLPHSVKADPIWLARALGELIENAIQYTEEGGTVDVRMTIDAQQINIIIQDSGIGIDPANLAHIFQPLYRVNQARTERNTGLGLAIALRVLRAHNGDIEVESVIGRGSTFTMHLPAA